MQNQIDDDLKTQVQDLIQQNTKLKIQVQDLIQQNEDLKTQRSGLKPVLIDWIENEVKLCIQNKQGKPHTHVHVLDLDTEFEHIAWNVVTEMLQKLVDYKVTALTILSNTRALYHFTW